MQTENISESFFCNYVEWGAYRAEAFQKFIHIINRFRKDWQVNK